MKFPVNEHILKVHFPPISEVKGWLAGAPSDLPLIDLCQAIPDYPPAPELTASPEGGAWTTRWYPEYSPDEGLPEVREAVCARYERVYGARINPRQLCLTIGASQAFWLAIMVLCRAGDEVVLQAPCYFDHPMALAMLGIRAVYAPFREDAGGLAVGGGDREAHHRPAPVPFSWSPQAIRPAWSRRRKPSTAWSGWRRATGSPCCWTRPTRISFPAG